MATRMKDIAAALGLSIVTVSKVLNKKDRHISKATRQRILECAQRMDYRPNLAAKSLATGKSKMIGLIVPELFHGFFGEVAAGMSDALDQQGYGLIISSSRDDANLEHREIRQMLARSVDALLVASCSSGSDALLAADIEVPVILLDRRVDDRGAFWFIGVDDLVVGELATQHLIDIGRKRIAFVGGPEFSPTRDRRNGYLKTLAGSGLKANSKWILELPRNEESSPTLGAAMMRQLLKLKPRPDAVFCYNDPSAWGVMLAALEAGLRVPEDIAILGCGDNMHSAGYRVPLSSVSQNSRVMGCEAANLAIRLIQSRSQKLRQAPMTLLLQPTLVVRDSTAGRQVKSGK